MSFKYWVLVFSLLVSLRPLSELLPLVVPWFRQGVRAVSQVSQGTGVPDPSEVTAPQTQPQMGTQADGKQTETRTAPPGTPGTTAVPADAYRWRPTPDDQLGVMLNEALVVQIVEPLSPAEVAGLNGGGKLWQ